MTVIVFFQTVFVLNKRRQINPTDTTFSSFAWWPSTDSSGRRGTAPPDWAWFLQRFFFSILSPMEFSFLAAVASGLLSWGHLISSTIIDFDCTDTILNWTKLDNAITKFNNEMHSADNWVLNPVILHYWQNCLFWYCAVLVTICIVKGAI